MAWKKNQRKQVYRNLYYREVVEFLIQLIVTLMLLVSAAMTCTASGMLCRVPYNLEEGEIKISEPTISVLPSRLFDWRLSSNSATFAYGGDEVDLSVWDTELVFRTHIDTSTNTVTPGSKKRKRNDDLFPAEVWRARNVSFCNANLIRYLRGKSCPTII